MDMAQFNYAVDWMHTHIHTQNVGPVSQA